MLYAITLLVEVLSKWMDMAMNTSSFFHLDCTGIIPECGFNCGKCIKEIESVLSKTKGADKFYREGDGIVVEHNPNIVTAEQLIGIFKRLPSFYKGFFIPTLMKT